MGAFDDDLPAGYRDADLETLELEEAARELDEGTAPPSSTMTTSYERETLELEQYADEHASGQLRLGVAGDQRPLLPLPDDGIPGDELDELEAPTTAPAPIAGQVTIEEG